MEQENKQDGTLSYMPNFNTPVIYFFTIPTSEGISF
jgi:hypothetical protein